MVVPIDDWYSYAVPEVDRLLVQLKAIPKVDRLLVPEVDRLLVQVIAVPEVDRLLVPVIAVPKGRSTSGTA